ncbi:helix-turn-helix transcriptional regulator [Pendulispora rubella]|uniref:Helix-turn-helix transcriptional regulator n=1 Tax=Pendulispora rubella TaxID=2741070 RepID=A0ABZ2L8K8_9BACT
MAEDERTEIRRELGAFLRSRRARLSPRDAGFAGEARRRTPGLRREEVAHLAGVGVTWYTWFEQGRDIQVSTQFLECISRALRLDATEREHLFGLAQNRPPPRGPSSAPEIAPALRRMLASIPGPAYLTTARWDVLAWNESLSAVFGDLESTPPAHRNMLWLVFTYPAYAARMTEWESDARSMLARFRVEFGRHRDDAAFGQLVRELKEASADFRRWWPEQDVLAPGEGVKRFQHPVAGEIEFEHTSFVVDGGSDLRLVVYTPLPGANARKVEKLRRAARER